MKAQDFRGLFIPHKPFPPCMSNFITLEAVFFFFYFSETTKAYYLAKRHSCPVWPVFPSDPDLLPNSRKEVGPGQ